MKQQKGIKMKKNLIKKNIQYKINKNYNKLIKIEINYKNCGTKQINLK